jgi:hypothetical protein
MKEGESGVAFSTNTGDENVYAVSFGTPAREGTTRKTEAYVGGQCY